MITPHIYLIIRYPVTGITPTQPYLEILCFQSICNLNASPPVQRATNINSSLPIRSFLDGWFLASTPTLKLSPTCLFLDVASQRGVKFLFPVLRTLYLTCIVHALCFAVVNCQSTASHRYLNSPHAPLLSIASILVPRRRSVGNIDILNRSRSTIAYPSIVLPLLGFPFLITKIGISFSLLTLSSLDWLFVFTFSPTTLFPRLPGIRRS